jgi:hypothetical protein
MISFGSFNTNNAFDAAASGTGFYGVAYCYNGDYEVQGAKTATSTNLTSTNFIGFADEAISSSGTGKVTVVGGVNTNKSGLTAGLKYYVTQGGSLSTTSTSNQYAGIATSSTDILVKG